jgi:hypothetical protein
LRRPAVLKTAILVTVATVLFVFAGCSGDDNATTTPAATGSHSPTPLGGGGSSTATTTTGASATTAQQGAAPSACSLLTQGQVAAIIGKPVGPGATPTDSHECDYRWDDPAGLTHFVEGDITVNEDLDLFQNVADGRNDVLAATITHIAGVGDEAVQVAPDIGVPFLWFRKGNLAFETSMQDSSGATSVAAQEDVNKQLALAALPNIP